MKKGLVFCGGGSKGAYQMGAWQALEELGLKFDIVTGTSIGCLNAAMYTQSDYDRCYELWDTINVNMIMDSGFNFDEKSIRTSLKKKQDLMPFLKKYIQEFGVDIVPFLNLMDQYIFPEKLKNSEIDFGLVTALFPSFKPVEVRVKDLEEDLIKKYILASCSCFPIFPVCKIGDRRYVDGGYYDNLPINFALNLGADEIVAIDLNVEGTHKEYMNMPYVKYIKPSWHLGSFMFFDHNIIVNNRTLGYNDTMKSYGKFLGFRYTFSKATIEINSRKFVVFVAGRVGKMRMLKLKTNVRPEKEGDLFYLLEKHTNRPLTDLEYFLRGMEIAGEFLNLNHLLVYSIQDFMNQIIIGVNSLEDNEELLAGYARYKNLVKQRDFLSRVDDKMLLKFLYSILIENEKIDENLLMNIMASKPIVFLIYAVIKTWTIK